MSGHPRKLVTAGAPHRHPMLLIDRLESLTPMRWGAAVKAVSLNEFHREGAVRDPTGALPPSLIVDALGQLAIIVVSGGSRHQRSLWYLGAIEAMRFGAPALPGDLLRMEAAVQRSWRSACKVAVFASVAGAMVAQGHIVLSGTDSRTAPPDHR